MPTLPVPQLVMARPQWRLSVADRITVCRLAVAPLLLLAAMAEATGWFAGLVVFGLATDAIDGRVARRLNSASPRGARLDSRADLAFCSAAVLGLGVLFPARLAAQWPLATTAAIAYVGPMVVGWGKFGRLTSYHTVLARLSLAMLTLALFCWLSFDTLFLLQTSVGVLVLSGIEELAITWKLQRPKDDVSHVFQLFTLDPLRREACVSRVHES